MSTDKENTRTVEANAIVNHTNAAKVLAEANGMQYIVLKAMATAPWPSAQAIVVPQLEVGDALKGVKDSVLREYVIHALNKTRQERISKDARARYIAGHRTIAKNYGTMKDMLPLMIEASEGTRLTAADLDTVFSTAAGREALQLTAISMLTANKKDVSALSDNQLGIFADNVLVALKAGISRAASSTKELKGIDSMLKEHMPRDNAEITGVISRVEASVQAKLAKAESETNVLAAFQ